MSTRLRTMAMAGANTDDLHRASSRGKCAASSWRIAARGAPRALLPIAQMNFSGRRPRQRPRRLIRRALRRQWEWQGTRRRKMFTSRISSTMTYRGSRGAQSRAKPPRSGATARRSMSWRLPRTTFSPQMRLRRRVRRPACPAQPWAHASFPSSPGSSAASGFGIRSIARRAMAAQMPTASMSLAWMAGPQSSAVAMAPLPQSLARSRVRPAEAAQIGWAPKAARAAWIGSAARTATGRLRAPRAWARGWVAAREGP
mmetsp:Transcript_15863/g.42809  ORF Transcript_15863/g.42809 Transcript_15863/m.42809 type:complete len:257 (+) Transcript_15863:124-894(+)